MVSPEHPCWHLRRRRKRTVPCSLSCAGLLASASPARSSSAPHTARSLTDSRPRRGTPRGSHPKDEQQ
eukprot:3118732-Alexandrium_andersonii.AAC.1